MIEWRFYTSSRTKQKAIAEEFPNAYGGVYMTATFVQVKRVSPELAGRIARKYHVKLDAIYPSVRTPERP